MGPVFGQTTLIGKKKLVLFKLYNNLDRIRVQKYKNKLDCTIV